MIYAIGDIQGCFAELQQLLNKIQFDEKNDQLWLVGDLVNRGPDSLETLRFIKNLGSSAITVLGNHDLHLLAVALANKPIQDEDTFHDILQAEDRETLLAWLLQQPFLYQQQGYTLVHAGIPPQWDLISAQQYANELSQQLQTEPVAFLNNMYGDKADAWSTQLTAQQRQHYLINAFTRMRFCDADGTLDLLNKTDQADPPYQPWFSIAGRKTRHDNIIFGHWAALQGNVKGEHVFALDTGCVWGGSLTALCLETQQRFSVKKS